MIESIPTTQTTTSDFIRTAVREDLESGRYTYVRTRFPLESNGYLHIGHAKAIAVDFGIARDFGGTCTCASTTPIQSRKSRNMLTRSWLTSAGWATNGMGCSSPAITSRRSTNTPSS